MPKPVQAATKLSASVEELTRAGFRPSRSRATASRPTRRRGDSATAAWPSGTATSTRSKVMKRLGLEDSGGAVSVGIVHYNTADEVDRPLSELETV
jgi:hypothetical protein